jgi:hypothetical protein
MNDYQVIISYLDGSSKENETGKDALLEAWANWPRLSYKEKLEIAKRTNAMYPESYKEAEWSLQQEEMKHNQYILPDSVSCHVGSFMEGLMVAFMSGFVANRMAHGGAKTRLDNLTYNGEKVELAGGLEEKIEKLRSEKN